MNDFRATLESLAAGTAEPAAVLAKLRVALALQATDPAAIAALIEGSYRAGGIPGQLYLEFMAVVRAAPVAAAASDEQDGRTRLRRSGEEGDGKTRFRPAAAHAQDGETRYRPISDQEPQGAAPPPSEATDRSGPIRSGPTGASWGDPSQWEHTLALQPGNVVKERFVLEEIIGQGGMGVVFKARDLRKEEAQDRNPYVALKVLNEDFKRHPESLKALQREARKAQNLAHPNIVTVYDFDRDGSNVYIVMELLEGEPLDIFIRSLDGRGLKIDQALPIIRALCSALSYAHQHHVVHSDFKPANAYITRGGAIKVFDFGIARAAKFKAEAGSADKDDTGSALTLFDAATLGALTPAYASCEMIEGLDPDPRDDVYALGCVTHELLTGAHPFQRKSAVQARDAKLKPGPVRGLTGRQGRGLRRALSFERERRSPSADAFLDEISPQRRSPAVWAGAAALVLIAVAVALLLPRYLQSRHVEALTVLVTSGSATDMEGALPDLMALPDTVRASMLLDEKVRNALTGHFRDVISAAFNVEQRRYDFPLAARRLAELRRLLPDSQAVAQVAADLEGSKNKEIARQSDALDESLEKGWLVAEQNTINVRSVLAIVAQIDPQHAMLGDLRLPSAYAKLAQLALDRKDIALAQSVASAGLAIAPLDATLQDLNDRIGREADARTRAARLAELRRRLGDEMPTAGTLTQLDEVHEDLLWLQAAEPRDAGLRRVQARLQQLLDRDIAALAGTDAFDEAQALLARYADLAPPDYVARQREALLGLYASRGVATATREAALAGRRQALDTLLASPTRDDTWDGRVRAQLAALAAYLPAEDAYVTEALRRAASVHLQAADALRAQGRLSEAERSLELAYHYSPELPQIAVERERLATLRAEQEARDQEQKRVAEVSARKQKFQDQVTANDVAAAGESLRVLRASLPADDPFLRAAPANLVDSYLRLAEDAARESRFDTAERLLGGALELDPGNARIAVVRAELTRQIATAHSAATSPPAAGLPQASDVTSPVVARVGTPASATQPAAPKVTAPATPRGACVASLAGYGTKGGGICYDALRGGRGPELVVVPTGNGIPVPFAISRFEISGRDYTLYCKQTGACTPGELADLPITGIAVNEAQQYAQWLSTSTGFTYRLPTEAEWIYVANAPEAEEKKTRDYNCIVERNGKYTRGGSLANVGLNNPNSWGLYNVIGNAREWVKTAQGWSARGGSYNDSMEQCDAGLAQASTGAADPATGFRLVREMP